MRPDRRRMLLLGTGLTLLTTLAACGGSDGPGAVLSVDASGVSTIDAANLSAVLTGVEPATLSDAEAASLLFMREEEQLAHDVYAVSATLWPQPLFRNIASSEATHAAAMATLIQRHALSDPMAGLPAGRFASSGFQALYDTLVAASRTSLVEALKVGLQIEELDIRDITAQKSVVDNADILLVYEHLLRGSRNHLRAFWKVLLQQGATYVPLYITQAEFDAIANSAVETGS